MRIWDHNQKAEWLIQGPNSRFVVTNLFHEPKKLYEYYTERGGTCEVRIDEFKNGLNADRLSCHRFIANQFRLFLHMAAYWLVLRRREALRKTEFASMQIQQLRLRLLKIGGQVIQTARRVWFRWPAVTDGRTFLRWYITGLLLIRPEHLLAKNLQHKISLMVRYVQKPTKSPSLDEFTRSDIEAHIKMPCICI